MFYETAQKLDRNTNLTTLHHFYDVFIALQHADSTLRTMAIRKQAKHHKISPRLQEGNKENIKHFPKLVQILFCRPFTKTTS